MFNTLRSRWLSGFLLFALVMAPVYLPYAFQLTYYRDDWYYAYDGITGPAGIFNVMFAIDRPARGPFFELYRAFFGVNPLPYHLGMFFWRLAGGLSVYWLFQKLWPRQRQAAFGAGLLFAIYPGFTWWAAGIEYQPMVASAALMALSFLLSFQALYASSSRVKFLLHLAAILTGWTYLSLVEYAVGMEVFRFALFYLDIYRKGQLSFSSRMARAFKVWFPSLFIPAGFLFWRVFLFQSERKATDIGVQLGSIFSDPMQTGAHWLLNFLISTINVVLSAWITPLMNNFFSGKLRETFFGLSFGALAVVIAWLVMKIVTGEESGDESINEERWPIHSIYLGAVGILFGILPIIIANRYIAFPNFSHYALPASLGAIFFLIGFVFLISASKARMAILMSIICLSALTHQGLGSAALREQKITSSFWHQMAWRVPLLKEGTTLLVYYPGFDYGEDTDVVWGPANFIYYPGKQARIPVHVAVAAIPADSGMINNILLGQDELNAVYRAHEMTINYDNMLIVSQPTEHSCVHVIDARWPEISMDDTPLLRLLAPHSRIQNVGAGPAPIKLAESIFGPEPVHGWCYYYQNAELARQHEDWKAIANLGDQAQKAGLHPNDQIEWMPFLQAYAVLGNEKQINDISRRINTETYYKRQACEIIKSMAKKGRLLSSEMDAQARELFCPN